MVWIVSFQTAQSIAASSRPNPDEQSLVQYGRRCFVACHDELAGGQEGVAAVVGRRAAELSSGHRGAEPRSAGGVEGVVEREATRLGADRYEVAADRPDRSSRPRPLRHVPDRRRDAHLAPAFPGACQEARRAMASGRQQRDVDRHVWAIAAVRFGGAIASADRQDYDAGDGRGRTTGVGGPLGRLSRSATKFPCRRRRCWPTRCRRKRVCRACTSARRGACPSSTRSGRARVPIEIISAKVEKSEAILWNGVARRRLAGRLSP